MENDYKNWTQISNLLVLRNALVFLSIIVISNGVPTCRDSPKLASIVGTPIPCITTYQPTPTVVSTAARCR